MSFPSIPPIRLIPLLHSPPDPADLVDTGRPADQLLIMKDGRIEDRGTFEELRKSGSLELALTGQESDGPG